jgi:carbon starvation protein CstA
MCLMWGMNWGFISQVTAFFIVTAVKTSHLVQRLFCLNLQDLLPNLQDDPASSRCTVTTMCSLLLVCGAGYILLHVCG